jgi:hypothetical protein
MRLVRSNSFVIESYDLNILSLSTRVSVVKKLSGLNYCAVAVNGEVGTDVLLSTSHCKSRNPDHYGYTL